MNDARLKVVAAFAVLMHLVVGPAAFSQTTRGAIAGTVVDQKGEPLPGVMVMATSPTLAMGQQATVVTDSKGEFRLMSLPSGTYTIQFRLDGYRDVDQDVRVNAISTSSLKATMTPMLAPPFTRLTDFYSDATFMDIEGSCFRGCFQPPGPGDCVGEQTDYEVRELDWICPGGDGSCCIVCVSEGTHIPCPQHVRKNYGCPPCPVGGG